MIKPISNPAWISACWLLTAAAARADAAADTNAPLPAVDAVLRRVIERVNREPENDKTFLGRYAFIRTKRTDTLDSKGKLQKREEREINHIPPVVVPPRHMEEFTGTARPGGPDKNVAEGRGRALEKRDFQLNEELLRRFEFTLAGREIREGRATLVLDFTPRPGRLPEKSFKDKFINKAAGRVWVDEAEAVLAQVVVRLTSGVSVVGGLVGNVRQCEYRFTRRRTPDGCWFTQTVDWRLEGRLLFSKRVMEYHEEKRDVRRVERE